MTLPAIGLGTWQTFDVRDPRPLQPLLARFVELGGTLIDSSPMYGRAEAVVGELAAKLGVREKLFLATKVWTRGKAAGIAQMNDSFRKLGTERVDLMQVHNLVDVDTHLATLREWKQQGRIGHVGITHYHAGAYGDVERVLRREPLDFLQINYSVAERDAEARLLPLARERGVAVIANRPFATGGLFSRLRAKPLPAFAAEIGCRSWAQLLLKWIVAHPAIACAIPATSSLAHLEDDMGAAMGALPDEKLRARIVEAVL